MFFFFFFLNFKFVFLYQYQKGTQSVYFIVKYSFA